MRDIIARHYSYQRILNHKFSHMTRIPVILSINACSILYKQFANEL